MKHSVAEKKFKNGLTILYIDIPGAKNFDLSISINSGYRYASKDDVTKHELPHILEHLVFDGSQNYPGSDDLEKIFSSGGGEFNGITSPYHNAFMFHNRIRNAKEVLAASLDMIFFPSLKEQSFNEEQRVIENELSEGLGDFSANASLYTFQQVLPDYPVSVDTQINRLPNNSYEDIRPYHEKYYDTSNTVIMIATDFKKVSKASIEKQITTALKNVPSGMPRPLPKFEVAKSNPSSTTPVPIHKTLTETISSTMLAKAGQLSRKEILSLGLFSALATNMKTYSVNHRLRKQGLVYGIDFAAMESLEMYGFELNINTQTDKFNEVYAYTLGELHALAKSGITDKQFKDSRRDFVESFEDKADSAEGVIGWYLQDYLMDRTVLSPDDYAKMASEISQKKMLELVNSIFQYDNLYQTVFSSKSIRAATSIDALSKEILKNEKTVDADLISKAATPIGSHDKAYVRTAYVLLFTLLAVALLPLTTMQWQASLSGIFIEQIGWPWKYVAPAYYAFLLLMPKIMAGIELRKTLAQMVFVFSAWMGIIAWFNTTAFKMAFTSGSMFLTVQAYVLIGILAIALAFSLLNLRKSN